MKTILILCFAVVALVEFVLCEPAQAQCENGQCVNRLAPVMGVAHRVEAFLTEPVTERSVLVHNNPLPARVVHEGLGYSTKSRLQAVRSCCDSPFRGRFKVKVKYDGTGWRAVKHTMR